MSVGGACGGLLSLGSSLTDRFALEGCDRKSNIFGNRDTAAFLSVLLALFSLLSGTLRSSKPRPEALFSTELLASDFVELI